MNNNTKTQMCTVGECDNKRRAKGYCNKHYQKFIKYGDPTHGVRKKSFCSIEGCGKEHEARGYCSLHYVRFKKHGDPLYEYEPIRKYEEKCSVEDCEEVHRSKGFCNKHHTRWKKHGSTSVVLKRGVKAKEGCNVDGCESEHFGKGYCDKHHTRFWKYGDPLHKKVGLFTTCTVDGCDMPHVGRGLCAKHLWRLRSYGDLHIPGRARKIYEHCTADGCKEKHFGRGYCYKHYNRSSYSKANLHRRRSRILQSPFNDFEAEDWLKCLEEFERSCAYCGANNIALEKEHVIPVSKNGSNSIYNIIPACRSCNASKTNNLFEEWYSKQPFCDREREEKILKWMGYKIKGDKIQMQLF